MANNKNINTDFVIMLPISQSIKRIDSTISRALPAPIPAWPIILNLFSILVCALFLKLGFWQLDRAHLRENLIKGHAQRLESPFVSLDQLVKNPEAASDKCVDITGIFLNDINFVVDNRIWNGQPGFTILTPLNVNGVPVLVDRGWLPLNTHNRQVPPIPTANGVQHLKACAYTQSGKPFLLKPDDYSHATWPMLVQSVEISKLQNTLNEKLSKDSRINHVVPPFVLRQESELSSPLVRDDPIASLNADRNYGYALQWFSFSAVLLFLTLILDWQHIRKVRQ